MHVCIRAVIRDTVCMYATFPNTRSCITVAACITSLIEECCYTQVDDVDDDDDSSALEQETLRSLNMLNFCE